MTISLVASIMFAGFSAERRVSMSAVIAQIGIEAIQSEWVDFQVFGDFHRRGAWWNARRAWEWMRDVPGTTHAMLLQDDVRVCRDFAKGVKKVIEAAPGEIISLFAQKRKAYYEGPDVRWGSSTYPWGQGIIIPSHMLADFLEFEAVHCNPACLHDDERVTAWLKGRHGGKRTLIPFPTLLDHRDNQMRSAMKNPSGNRVSFDFLGHGDRSPLDFDWEVREDRMMVTPNASLHKGILLND